MRLPASSQDSASDHWPAVTVVVPARNEAAVLPHSLPTLLGQDYPGRLEVVVVDDSSTDGTADAAASLAGGSTARDVAVISAPSLPNGWAGKVWAMHTGAASDPVRSCDYVLFTDADIAHPPDLLRRLVGQARRRDLDLASVMAQLRMVSPFERLLVPAFVYFFGLLYPFRWSNDPNHNTAAAAGGCVLVRRSLFERAGGFEPIRGEIIDDCALAAAVKRAGGRTWLGLARDVRSLRGYAGLSGVWHVVARTAYTQLGYSPVRLVGTVVGLVLIFGAPPAAAIAGIVGLAAAAQTGLAGATLAVGLLAWGLMAFSYLPMTRWYGGSVLRAATLPLAAAIYVAMTVDSARRHRAGIGGGWKGRAYDS